MKTKTINKEQIYSVSQLNQLAKTLLEDCFPTIWLEGEISNFSCPASGHWYFSLKDEQAQLGSAMFKGRNMRLNFTPKNGMQVLVRGKISLYAPRGQYQLIVDHMEEAGDGRLKRQFEALKKQLTQEGLFAEQHKKPLPELAQCIGVITSPTGAVIRDILTVLRRRFPAIPVIIYPTAVQGEQAAPQIIKAIELANKRQECDVLILARGGGSLEDLWPFNEEAVARAIFASKLPLISSIGHEVDYTIADFVADQRAPTPSAAAELVSPDRQHWLNQCDNLHTRLQYMIKAMMNHHTIQLNSLQKRLRHPQDKLNEQAQQLDYLSQQLYRTWKSNLQQYQQRIVHLASTLNAMSPLATLERGYAIVYNEKNQAISSVKKLKRDHEIKTKLSDGTITAKVTHIDKKSS